VRNIFSEPDTDILGRGTNDNFELLKAWGGTSLAFAVVQVGGQVFNLAFVPALALAALTCGIGFLLHELGHRVVARSYGAEAHFIANNGWLLISILLAFTGFFIAAPGAVWHRGHLTKRQGGLIALAGPATNYVLAILFLILLIIAVIVEAPEWVFQLSQMGFYINGWLGLFNMIPAGPFDGAKVLNWSPLVFGITVAIGILLAFVLQGRTLFSLISLFT